MMAAAALALSVPAVAQDEAALRSAFEGRRVVLRIDMPGTQEGVDVQADGRARLDVNAYRARLRQSGAAIRAGDAATVTLVKLKKDLIEFQLDGGGYGSFGDDTSTTVNMPLVEKSDRERDLEKRLKDVKDPDERRRMQRELDDLRGRRERENRRITVEKERAEARKAQLLAERRLRGGSRFNVRWSNRVPPELRPRDIEAALAEWVDFNGGTAPRLAAPPPSGDVSQLRKGMRRDEVEQLFGRPAQSTQKSAANLTIVTLVFDTAGARVTADFVEDVLVSYVVASR